MTSPERYPSVAGPPGREHVSYPDAAAYLGVSVRWLKRAALRPDGPPSAMLGAERRFPLRAMDAWLDNRFAA